MRPKIKYLLVVLLVCILAASFYAYQEYNRRPADLKAIKPLASTDAVSLSSLYSTDEQKANAMYLGKAIDVTGVIAEINSQQDTLVNVMLGGPDDLHRVSCLLDIKNVNMVKQFKQGDRITLRGICTGFLVDVELNRCVIIN